MKVLFVMLIVEFANLVIAAFTDHDGDKEAWGLTSLAFCLILAVLIVGGAIVSNAR